MHLLSDEALWAAAQPTLSPAQRLRLEQLNHIAGARELTKQERVSGEDGVERKPLDQL
jgi:hypothetical protein